MNVNALLTRNVNSAVHISLANSPIGRIHITCSVLGSLNLHRRKPALVDYPAYKHAHVDLRGLTLRIRHHLTSIRRPVAITIVNYIIGKPNRTHRTSINVTNNVNRKLIFHGNRVLQGIPRRRLMDRLFTRVSGVLLREGMSHW